MLELILLIISILCLTWSAQAAVFFLLIAVGISAYRRRTLNDEIKTLRTTFADLNQNVHRALLESNEKVENLTRQVGALRAAEVTANVAPTQAATQVAKAPETKVPEVTPVTLEKPVVTEAPSKPIGTPNLVAPVQPAVSTPEHRPSDIKRVAPPTPQAPP